MTLRVRHPHRRLQVRTVTDLPFQGMAAGRVPRTGMLLTSVAAHLLLVIVISVISREIALWSRDDQLDWSRYTVEPLRSISPNRSIFRQAQAGQTPLRRPSQGPLGAPRKPGSGQTSISRTRGSRRPATSKPNEKAINAPAVVQPDFVPSRWCLPHCLRWLSGPSGLDLPKPPRPEEVVTRAGQRIFRRLQSLALFLLSPFPTENSG